jgi:hypothetical protein
MDGVSRVARLLLIAAAVGCRLTDDDVRPNPRASSAGVCTPTLARMVPPQFVLDYVLGGIQTQHPDRTMSREAFGAVNNYLGNDTMWLALPVDGRVRGLTLSVTAIQAVSGRIEVTAERSDGPAGPARFERDEDSRGGPRDRSVTIHFPSPGCWDVTYTLARSELRFTVLVQGLIGTD